MTADSRTLARLIAAGEALATVWRQLGEIDRWLDRHRVEPDRVYARATAVVLDSSITKAMRWFGERVNPATSHAVALGESAHARFQKLDRWQQVRLVGVALTTALIVHGLLCVALPARFAPRLPAVVWGGAAALGLTLIVASRAVVAAWNDVNG